MRTLLTTIALAGLGVSCVTSGRYKLVADGFRFDYEGAVATRADSGRLGVEGGPLEVDHRFGRVRVVAGAEPGWTWRAEAWADDEETAAAILAETEVRWTESAEGLTVALAIPRDRQAELRGLRSVLEITALPSTPLAVRARHSGVEVEGFSGHAALEVEFGDVAVTSIGSVGGRGAHGDWRVDDVAAFLSIETEHGDVRASGVRGDARITCRHGDVEVLRPFSAAGQWETVVRSEYGDVTVDVPAGGRARVEQEFGDVWIRHDLAAGETIEASTRFGDVSSDLPISAQASSAPAIRAFVEFGDLRIRRVSR